MSNWSPLLVTAPKLRPLVAACALAGPLGATGCFSTTPADPGSDGDVAVSSQAVSSLPTGLTGYPVSIRATVNEEYVTGERSPYANNINPSLPQAFLFSDQGNGNVALYSMYSNLNVSAVPPPYSSYVLYPDVGAVGSWETYRFVSLGGSNFALQAQVNGLYVTTNGTSALAAGAQVPSTWETFTWMPAGMTQYPISIRAANGLYVTAQNAGNGPLRGYGAPDTWETFQIRDLGQRERGPPVAGLEQLRLRRLPLRRHGRRHPDRGLVGDVPGRAPRRHQLSRAQVADERPLRQRDQRGSRPAHRRCRRAGHVGDVQLDARRAHPVPVTITAAANHPDIRAPAGGGPLYPNAGLASTAETFQIVDLGNGNVALQSLASNKYARLRPPPALLLQRRDVRRRRGRGRVGDVPARAPRRPPPSRLQVADERLYVTTNGTSQLAAARSDQREHVGDVQLDARRDDPVHRVDPRPGEPELDHCGERRQRAPPGGGLETGHAGRSSWIVDSGLVGTWPSSRWPRTCTSPPSPPPAPWPSTTGPWGQSGDVPARAPRRHHLRASSRR